METTFIGLDFADMDTDWIDCSARPSTHFTLFCVFRQYSCNPLFIYSCYIFDISFYPSCLAACFSYNLQSFITPRFACHIIRIDSSGTTNNFWGSWDGNTKAIMGKDYHIYILSPLFIRYCRTVDSYRAFMFGMLSVHFKYICFL